MVSGTRPEIIKLAPLYHALKAESWVDLSWLHTGQHAEMASQLLTWFQIKPNHSFTRAGQSLFEFSQHCRIELEQLIQAEDWSLIIIQGDTETAFLGAMAGFYHQIPVAHVEAGLRTYRLDRPFPEEGLRQLIARVTRFHFAPTPRARENLLAERIPESHIFMTGNTGIDAQLWTCKALHQETASCKDQASPSHLLVTIHRRENWGKELESVCQAIATVSERYPDMRIVFPVHLNPVVHKTVHRLLGQQKNVHLSEPLDYPSMQKALMDAWLVMTDSGGLQEETPTFGIPLLVLREETERPEVLESGCAQVVGTHTETLITAISQHWENRYQLKPAITNPFGDGHACTRIVAALKNGLAG